MTENKPRRLNEVVSAFAPEGANDTNWLLVEHQLVQAKMSVDVACSVLAEIRGNPENNNERKVAEDCYSIARGMRVDILDHYATFLSYLSDTDVPERISRKEL